MADRDEALRIVEGHVYQRWEDDDEMGWGGPNPPLYPEDVPAVLVIGATADEIRAALKAHRGDTGGTDGQG